MFLERCIKSLREQTCDNLEIILVDDGSVDGSSEICDFFANADERVSVIHQENAGVSAARNAGVNRACGKYAAFVDADDWVDSNVCEILFNACEKQDYDLFCFSAVYNSSKKCVESILFADDIELFSQEQKEELLCKVMTPWAPWYSFNCNTRFAGSVCGKFYKLEILQNKQLFFSRETIISEDCLFNILSLDYFDKIGYSSKVFYHYEQHVGSAQNRYRPNSMKYFGFVVDQIQSWLDKNDKNQRVWDCANTLFVHYLFGSLKEDYFHKDNPDKKCSCNELKKILSQEKFHHILCDASKMYFSLPERMLVWLMRKKKILFIRLIMGLYRRLA